MSVNSASYNEGFRGQPEVAFTLPSPFSTQTVESPHVKNEHKCLMEDCLGAMYGVNHAYVRACLSHNWSYAVSVVAPVVQELNDKLIYDAVMTRVVYRDEGSPSAQEFTYISIRRRPLPTDPSTTYFTSN